MATASSSKGLINQESDNYFNTRHTNSNLGEMCLIPNNPLNLYKADVFEVQRRYRQIYIPSSFYEAHIRWVEHFPIDRPFSLERPCSFHVMYKHVEPIVDNEVLLTTSDADYTYHAKVMLISIPEMQDIYRKCCSVIPEGVHQADDENRVLHHLNSQLAFLVGVNGNKTTSIGGPWSPSMDGPDPENDPSVLIRTAIRTCKALTGIDLEPCSQWYRFVELQYSREEIIKSGCVMPTRIEKVVIFLPDIWSCMPNQRDYDELKTFYITSQSMNEIHCILKEDSSFSEGSISTNEEENALAFKRTEDNGSTELSGEDWTIIDIEKPQDNEVHNADQIDSAQLKKFYSEFPDDPRIIVHPSQEAYFRNFDCAIVSLSDLLAYSPDNTTESLFEVSLFAELFNEMLMRDFGFNIYKCICKLAENKSGDEEDTIESLDNNFDCIEVGVHQNTNNECIKLTRNDPYLLLSFEYFDLSHCGYMSQKNITMLLYTLGLNLSRKQVRNLFVKTKIKDCLLYRKLFCSSGSDNSKTATELPSLIDNNISDNLNNRTVNKRQLSHQSEFSPLCKKKVLTEDAENGTCKCDSINVEKLMTQLKSCGKALESTEARLIELNQKIVTLSDDNIHANNNVEIMTETVSGYKIMMWHTEENLRLMTEKCYKYHFALQEIRSTIRKLKKQKKFESELKL